MKTEISELRDLDEEHSLLFSRFVKECNDYDDTAYVFDGADDFKRKDETNHFVLRCDGVPAAALYLFAPTSAEAEAYCFTLPPFRRQGFMKLLLGRAGAELERRAIGDLLLVCDGNSEEGRGFLEHVGAEYRFSEYSMVWKPGKRKPAERHVELRRSGPDDRERLIEINGEAFGDRREDSEKRIDLFLSSETREFYSILRRGEVVGMIGRYMAGPEDYIHGFAMAREARGRGWGRQALVEMIGICRASAPSRQIALEVETENEGALNLYKKCGFETIAAFGYYFLPFSRFARQQQQNGEQEKNTGDVDDNL